MNSGQRKWLEDRLWSLYDNALANDGEVSLGKGKSLFDGMLAYGLKRIDAAADERLRLEGVNRVVQAFETASGKHIDGIAEPLRQFAFETIPVILNRQQSQYQTTAVAPTEVIDDILGRAAEARYVVERMEQWPQHLQVTQDNAWRALGFRLSLVAGAGVFEQPAAKDLDPRALKLIIAELKAYLVNEESSDDRCFHRPNAYFWSQKEAAFAAAADEVYREHKTSGRRVLYVAKYLWDGLEHRDRAIEMLLAAQADGLLDVYDRQTLVGYLRSVNRYAETIPLLEQLVRDLPDRIDLRTELMEAYSHTRCPQQLSELVKQTEQYFHKEGRWHESNIAQLAQGCLDCRLYDEAIAYFNEAISAHQRANPGAGLGDGTLLNWYQQLAQAYSALHHTNDAVEAASAAVVCWDPRQSQRVDAINRLKSVLKDAKDIDAYVKHLEAESAKMRKTARCCGRPSARSIKSGGNSPRRSCNWTSRGSCSRTIRKSINR